VNTPSIAPAARSFVDPASLDDVTFVVVGAGRLGTSLALALTRAGARLRGFLTRTAEGAARAEALLGMAAAGGLLPLLGTRPSLVLLTVPDEALPGVASAVADALPRDGVRLPTILHTSGATPLAVLDPCAVAGCPTLAFHPLQTFSDPIAGSERFPGTSVALTAGDAGGEELGQRLALALEARPFPLADEQRALYHAAACVASNYLVTLVDVASELFARAGLPEDAGPAAFLPLVQGTVDNLRAQGAVGALTGPLSRGDAATVRAHLRAIAQASPRTSLLYGVLGTRTLDVVRRQARLAPQELDALSTIFDTITASECPRRHP
jgi:predicted short-subunit dehydrogenase-like oxidoreductase (DUF2520 family)